MMDKPNWPEPRVTKARADYIRKTRSASVYDELDALRDIADFAAYIGFGTDLSKAMDGSVALELGRRIGILSLMK